MPAFVAGIHVFTTLQQRRRGRLGPSPPKGGDTTAI
jgi:hypothetical protein